MDVDGRQEGTLSVPRPRRPPCQTRSRRIATAAQLLQSSGLLGTGLEPDRTRGRAFNRSVLQARQDERDIFLAAYEQLSVATWKNVATILSIDAPFGRTIHRHPEIDGAMGGERQHYGSPVRSGRCSA